MPESTCCIRAAVLPRRECSQRWRAAGAAAAAPERLATGDSGVVALHPLTDSTISPSLECSYCWGRPETSIDSVRCTNQQLVTTWGTTANTLQPIPWEGESHSSQLWGKATHPFLLCFQSEPSSGFGQAEWAPEAFWPKLLPGAI